MNNGPQVSNSLVHAKLQSKVLAGSGNKALSGLAFSRTTMAASLMVAAIAALTVTGLVQTDRQAAANTTVATSAPSVAAMLPSLPLDSGELVPFSFGFLVFESDPVNHIPGFGPLSPAAPAQ